jgi:GNAT superfamily N-acetyltransferase
VVLVRCCVLPAHRRRGIGAALTRARLAAALTQGAHQAVLSPSPDGARLHESQGFALVPAPPDRWFYL